MRLNSIAIPSLVATIFAVSLAGCGAIDAFQKAKATRTESFEVPIPEAKQCKIRTVNGRVECIAGSDGEIHVEAEISARARTIEEAEEMVDQITVDLIEIDGVAEITANIPRRINGSVSLTVTLPAGVELEVETSNGPIEVIGITSGTKARTSNGKIRLEECTGEIEAKSSNGSIKIYGDQLREVNAVSSNGSIEIEGEFAAGKHRVKTSNGRIEVEAYGRPIRFEAQTSNGRIRANGRKVKSGKTVTMGLAGSSVADEELALFALQTSNGSIDVEHEPARSRDDEEGDDEEDDEEDDESDEDEEETDEQDDGDDDDEDDNDDKQVRVDKELPIGAAILEALGF